MHHHNKKSGAPTDLHLSEGSRDPSPPLIGRDEERPAVSSESRPRDARAIVSQLERLVREIDNSRSIAERGDASAELREIKRSLRELQQKVADSDECDPASEEELDPTVVGRIGASQKTLFRSMMAICSNVLDNSREIERLSRIVDGLPEARREHLDLHRVLSNLEAGTRGLALSTRETEILAQLLRGISNREISQELGISEKTVKNHLWKIYRKIGVDSRAQLFHKLIS